MGKYDSSMYRVRPVFDALWNRDPTGRTWLSELLALPECPGRASMNVAPGALGDITTAAWNSMPCIAGDQRRKEASLPAPRSLLLHLVEQMQDPISRTAWGTGDVEAKRRQLHNRVTEVQQEAKEYLTGARPSAPHRSRWEVLEGPTRPDVYIETSAAIIVIEGKFTESAPTTKTTWMATRSQMLRHIDAAWDQRDGRRIYGFFIVESTCEPGWVHACEETLAPSMVSGSLPHRSAGEQAAVADAFLGITTWAEVCGKLEVDKRLLLSRQQIDARSGSKGAGAAQ